MQAAATLKWQPGPGWIAVRVVRRATRKIVLSPMTWVLVVAAVAAFVVVNGRVLLAPLALAAPPKDAADTYVQALQTGNVDAFLSTLAPDAHNQLSAIGRFATDPTSQAERRAARIVLAQDQIERYTRLGQHTTKDGSFVVYAIERDGADGTHTTPLVVWLDEDGHVVRSTQ